MRLLAMAMLLLGLVTHSRGLEAAKANSSSTSESASISSTSSSGSIDVATADSTTFRLVGLYNCNTTITESVQLFYTRNRNIFDTCVTESGYQIFPYSGTVPTATNTAGMVGSTACMAAITAAVMLGLPPCAIGEMPIKASVETLLKISVDMGNGADAPTPEQFHSVLAWRRDVDLAYEAGVPYDGNSTLYAEFTKALKYALLTTNVTVSSSLVISTGGSSGSDDTATITFSNAGSSLRDSAGTVTSDDSTSSSSSDAGTPATAKSSNALRPQLTTLCMAFLTVAVAVMAL